MERRTASTLASALTELAVFAASHDRLRSIYVRRAWRGIEYVEHLEGDGAVIFEHACKLGLEGIVCKRIDLPYRPAPRKAGSR